MTDVTEKEQDKKTSKDVRDSGKENMENPPEEWTEVDEELDESFPASDPPANY